MQIIISIFRNKHLVITGHGFHHILPYWDQEIKKRTKLDINTIHHQTVERNPYLFYMGSTRNHPPLGGSPYLVSSLGSAPFISHKQAMLEGESLTNPPGLGALRSREVWTHFPRLHSLGMEFSIHGFGTLAMLRLPMASLHRRGGFRFPNKTQPIGKPTKDRGLVDLMDLMEGGSFYG